MKKKSKTKMKPKPKAKPKTKGDQKMNYPYIANSGDTPLTAAYKESLTPEQAALYQYTTSDPRREELAIAYIQAGGKIDRQIMVDGGDVLTIMTKRQQEGLKEVPAWTLGIEQDPFVNKTKDTFKVSTDPADFPPYSGTGKMRERWVGNEISDGKFGLSEAATAYPRSGNPKQNPRVLTDFVSPTPGENGALLTVDKYGVPVPPGTKDSHRYRLVEEGGGYFYQPYDKVAEG